MRLWVAEKKSLAEAVADVLGRAEAPWEARGLTHNRVGDDYFVWLDGHAFDQAMPDHYLPDDVPRTQKGNKVWRQADLPIIPERWTLFPKESKKRRLQKLAELLPKAEVVYHVGDPEPEGQLIVDEALLYYRNTKPVKRVLINDYNETKVREALANVRDNSEPLFRGWYKWALARSRYDWMLGLNATRAMTLRGRALGFNGLLPVGSVQTPMLYVVRERDREIESFTPALYYTLAARLMHANGTFTAHWKPGEDQQGLDAEGRLVDQATAERLAEQLTGGPATITEYSKTKKTQNAPLPLDLDELQGEAFTRFGYSAQATLDAAQKLYETHKVLSYPRTDNRYLSEAQHAEAPAIIGRVLRVRPDLEPLRELLDPARKSAAFDDAKMAGTPHHGIVPTLAEKPVDPTTWSEAERNVYDLAVRAYLAQFAPPHEYLQTKIAADVAGERFTASGRTPVAPGWKAVYGEIDGEDQAPNPGDADDLAQTLPAMAQGDAAECENCGLTARKTTPPPRFDEKLLLKMMGNIHKHVTDEAARRRLKEGEGIGTSATRGPIISEVQARELLIPVKADSKKLKTAPATRTLIDALLPDVKDPAQAGRFKTALDRVAQGDLAFDEFMAQTAAWVTQVVEAAATLNMKLPEAAKAIACPKCGTGRLRRKQREGGGAFWFCVNWNREADPCSAKFQDVKGTPLLNPIACPSCKDGHLRRKAGNRGAFWFCSNWNAEARCEAKYNDKAGKPDLAPRPSFTCPSCKQGKLRQVKGANGLFWGCSRYREGCSATYPNKAGKPDLTPPVPCPVCKQGKLRRIKGAKGHFWGCSHYKAGCSATYPDRRGRPNLAVPARQ